MVVKGLSSSLEKCNGNLNGLEKFINNIDDAEMSKENIRQKLKTLMKVEKEQISIIKQFLLINLIYVSSDTFTTDAAKLTMKLGRGEEALQAMFKAKMSGN